ncbi:MAG: polyprenyl synthetase family protein [Nanoarchaeota archaeon]
MVKSNDNLEKLVRSAGKNEVIRAVNALPFFPSGIDIRKTKHLPALPYLYYVSRVLQDVKRVYQSQTHKTLSDIKEMSPTTKIPSDYFDNSRYIHSLIGTLAHGFSNGFQYNQKPSNEFDPNLSEQDYKINPTFVPYGLVLALAGIETVISMSETLDDVFDNSEERRGKETYHYTHGWKAATLSSDLQLIDSLEIVDGISSYYIRKVIREAAKTTAKGQGLEIDIQRRLAAKGIELRTDSRGMSDEDSEKFIAELMRKLKGDREKSSRMKTSALIECAADCGTFYGGLKPQDLLKKAIMRYSREFGIMHQIRNDLDDVQSGRAEDMRDGVLNLVVFGALSNPDMAFDDKLTLASTLTRQYDRIKARAILPGDVIHRANPRPTRRLSKLEEEEEREQAAHETMFDDDLAEAIRYDEEEDPETSELNFDDGLSGDSHIQAEEAIKLSNQLAHEYGSEGAWERINREKEKLTRKVITKISPDPVGQRVLESVVDMIIKE